MSLVVLRRWTFAIFAQTDIKNEDDDLFMKHSILTIFVFATLLLSNANVCAQDPKGVFMMEAEKKIKVDDKLCYQMKQLTFLVMAAKRFMVVECEPINRVKFFNWIFFRLFN